MRVITFFNNKGGVGKTTLAVNMASFLSNHYGKRVLFLDADPQANSTQMIIPEEMWEEFYGDNASKSTLINYMAPIQEGDSNLNFEPTPFPSKENKFNVDLIPGHPSLSIIEDILSDGWNKCVGGDLGGFRKTNWLKALIHNYEDIYDYMFIDVGPSLGALNRSILLNTDFVVTPMGSDIFSLIGVSNISTWIDHWQNDYANAIALLIRKYGEEVSNKYPLNFNIHETTRLVGYSIQQYVTKSFAKEGRRPVASYDRIVSKMPETIQEQLNFLIPNSILKENLNLGDVPYLYSLVPIAQSAKAPMYNLSYAEGVRGNQVNAVKRYKEMLETICRKLIINVGEENAN